MAVYFVRVVWYLERASGDLVQRHDAVQALLVQLPHVHLIELLQVRRHQETVVCNTRRQQRTSELRQGHYCHVFHIFLLYFFYQWLKR